MISESIPNSLAREGALMLNALAFDLLQVATVDLIVVRDHRISLPQWMLEQDGITILTVDDRINSFRHVWNAAFNSCDAIWPIAPESDGILEGLCKDVEHRGKILLNSQSKAVRKTASKINTCNQLARNGIPSVPSYGLKDFKFEFGPPWIVKPDDGVGCEECRIISDKKALVKYRADPTRANFIIQPLTEGDSISLSILFYQGAANLLSCNRQIIDIQQNTLRLSACHVNAFQDLDGRFAKLANQIAKNYPDLWGYAGVDLIQGKLGPMVLEINPRLTTCYAGLGDALGINAAEWVLDLLRRPITGKRLMMPKSTSVIISLEQSHAS